MKRGDTGKIVLFSLMLMMIPMLLAAQDEREYIRKGNRLYEKSEFSGGEAMYRRAQNQENSTANAGFNLGDALYKQGKYSEAAGEFDRAAADYEDTTRRAESFYNLGNAMVKDKKYKESIEAYINSLKLKPDNMEAKYNLAYAQDQLKKQEEQEKQQQQQKDQNKDKSDENQDKKKEQPQEQPQEQDKPEQQQGTMSREDAKRLLEALSAAEKKTQEKVRQEKAKGAKTRVIKNW